MAGQATRERILDAAERHFADYGFAGASLRGIVADANVNQAAIHYHFRTKQALFDAVVRRRLEPLNRERLRRLSLLETDAGGGAPEVEAISAAFVSPSIELRCVAEHGAVWQKLIARYGTDGEGQWADIEEMHRATIGRFVAAFQRALPDVPEAEVEYRTYLLVGAAMAAIWDCKPARLVGDERLTVEEDAEGVLTRVISFVSAGMRAQPANHRIEPRSKTATSGAD